MTSLQERLASAAILLPVVAAATALGHPYFDVLVAAFVGIMAWEWAHVCERGRWVEGPAETRRSGYAGFSAIEIASIAIAVFSVLAAGFGAIDLSGAFWLPILSALLMVAFAWPRHRLLALWFGLGVFYVTLPSLALLGLRADPGRGSALVLWVIALSVAADTLAYMAGRGIGGPKLAPRISPNKTWAGLGGAIIGAGLAGAIASFWLNPEEFWKLTLFSAVLGVVEQGGDLVESAFKRHFGVKDSSRIIPGHGGVLDRVDGLLAVALAVALVNDLGGARFLHGGS